MLWVNHRLPESSVTLRNCVHCTLLHVEMACRRRSLSCSIPPLKCAIATLEKSSETILDSAGGELDDRDVVRLSVALESNSTVLEIWLDDSDFGNRGAIRLAAALQLNGTIQRIGLNNNHIASSGAKCLASLFAAVLH